MRNLVLLWKHMRGYRLLYLGAILSVVLATLFTTAGPLVVRTTIDSVIGSEPLPPDSLQGRLVALLGGPEALAGRLWIPGLFLFGLTVLRGLFLFFRGKWSATAAESIVKGLREKVYIHLQYVPYDYHIKAETGDLIQRCTSDMDTIRRFLAVQFVEIGNSISMILLISYIMLSLDVKMALVAMAVIPVIFVFAVIFFLKVKKAFKLADEAEARMSTVLQENLTAVRVVKAFAREDYEIAKFEEKNSEHRDLVRHLIRLLAWYWSTSDILCLLQIALVVVAGAYWTARGEITLGTLVVFTTYEGMLLWPVRQLGRILTDMGKAFVAVRRVQEILEAPAEVMDETGQQPPIRGEIEFRGVSFGYEPGKPVLKDISFRVEPGQTVAVIGPTGSGKSSLVHLLARLYDYQEGSIKIDGVELKHLDKRWIRQNVGLVLQEPFLFAKTIKENIALASSNADDQAIVAAARAASIHEVILEFDKGYDTLVGERGVSLSGGQRQRVAIARTLIRNCPIIVFDDSLSAVDTETDAAIRQALKERTKQTTTFIISHRVASVMDADLIIVLENGRITQVGTHDELIAQPGLYSRIWDIQNSLEEELTGHTA